MNLTILIIAIITVIVITLFLKYFFSEKNPDTEMDNNYTSMMNSRYKK
jgi:uncharacterized protein YneF (UPF0154 family)